MEVVGSTLFAIQNNVLRAYDVVSEGQIGFIPIGVTFLNGMGSYSNDVGISVVSDFGTGRILKGRTDLRTCKSARWWTTQARRPTASPWWTKRRTL